MILKLFILLIAASLAATMLLRQPQAKRRGWIVTGALVLLALLIVQILRTLDTLWR